MEHRKIVRVFFFGDSICVGQGVSPHHCWVTRIGETLERTFGAALDIVVQNPSVNGNTTRMALERMAYDVQSHAPHILYVQFGMNDCNVWRTDRGRSRVSAEAFAANLGEIVDRGRAFGALTILLGTNHPSTRTATSLPGVDYAYEQANRLYNEIIRRVSQEKKTRLADAEKAFDAAVATGQYTYSELILGDEVHLSRMGHDLYFQDRLPLVSAAVAEAALVI